MKLLTILASVGAINWLLVAFNWNLVEAILGQDSILTNAVYIVVGIAGVLLLIRVCKCKGGCSKKCNKCSVPAATQASTSEEAEGLEERDSE